MVWLYIINYILTTSSVKKLFCHFSGELLGRDLSFLRKVLPSRWVKYNAEKKKFWFWNSISLNSISRSGKNSSIRWEIIGTENSRRFYVSGSRFVHRDMFAELFIGNIGKGNYIRIGSSLLFSNWSRRQVIIRAVFLRWRII